jgi:hypothetical protein
LENNFRGQFSVTALHIWLSLARLRSEGAVGKQMSQKLYDDWWEDVQKRVRDEGVRFCNEFTVSVTKSWIS